MPGATHTGADIPAQRLPVPTPGVRTDRRSGDDDRRYPPGRRTGGHDAEIARLGTVNAQLQEALTSRIAIEQAKGYVAGVTGSTIDAAFGALQQFARHHNLKIADVCRAVMGKALPPEMLLDRSTGRSRSSEPG